MKSTKQLLLTACICISLMATGCSPQNASSNGINAVGSNNEAIKAAETTETTETQINIDNKSTTQPAAVYPLQQNQNDMEKLVELENEAIAIYTNKDGEYVLQFNEKQYVFDWPGLTPRGTLPRLSYDDFDQDGVKELAVILYTGAGTGIAIEDLHVLEVNADGSLIDHMYASEQYIDALEKQAVIEIEQQEQALQGTITYNNQSTTVDLTALLDEHYGEVGKKLTWGNIVYFSTEQDKLIGSFKANITVANWATPIVIADVIAHISYNSNGEFKLQINEIIPEQHIE